jgi:hypothetical protein
MPVPCWLAIVIGVAVGMLIGAALQHFNRK